MSWPHNFETGRKQEMFSSFQTWLGRLNGDPRNTLQWRSGHYIIDTTWWQPFKAPADIELSPSLSLSSSNKEKRNISSDLRLNPFSPFKRDIFFGHRHHPDHFQMSRCYFEAIIKKWEGYFEGWRAFLFNLSISQSHFSWKNYLIVVKLSSGTSKAICSCWSPVLFHHDWEAMGSNPTPTCLNFFGFEAKKA